MTIQKTLGAVFVGAALGFSISSYSDSPPEINASAGHVSVVHEGEGVMFETGPGGRIKVWEKVPAETHHSLHTDTGGAVVMVYTPPGIVSKQEAMKALTPEQRGDRAVMRALNEKHGHFNVPNAE